MSQSKLYTWGGFTLGIGGVLWVLFGTTAEVEYTTIQGVSVFAVLYVIAQGAERITEFVVAGLSLIPDSPEQRKKSALSTVRAANSTLNGNPAFEDFSVAVDQKEDAKKEADKARKDIMFVGLGVSIALCALAVNGLNYGIMRHLGATGVDSDLDRLITAMAAAGGSKTLHELIGRFQKSKETSEET